MRKAIDSEKIYKNCVSSLYLPFTKEMNEMQIEEIAKNCRNLTSLQKSDDYVKSNADKMTKMFNSLSFLSTFEEKQEKLDSFNHLLINTFVISYPGSLNLGD
ncbi:MAG: hypothetical protein WCR67_04730 [Bacilli bacterium]